MEGQAVQGGSWEKVNWKDGERSPQLPCLLTVMFFRTGIQHKQLPKCLPNFLCLADGVRTRIMGKMVNLSDPVCWGSRVLMVLPFLVLQL